MKWKLWNIPFNHTYIFHQMVLQDARVSELSPVVSRGLVETYFQTISLNNLS